MLDKLYFGKYQQVFIIELINKKDVIEIFSVVYIKEGKK